MKTMNHLIKIMLVFGISLAVYRCEEEVFDMDEPENWFLKPSRKISHFPG